jgi:hypothetical protein
MFRRLVAVFGVVVLATPLPSLRSPRSPSAPPRPAPSVPAASQPGFVSGAERGVLTVAVQGTEDLTLAVMDEDGQHLPMAPPTAT